jgi:hypothetical protein
MKYYHQLSERLLAVNEEQKVEITIDTIERS